MLSIECAEFREQVITDSNKGKFEALGILSCNFTEFAKMSPNALRFVRIKIELGGKLRISEIKWLCAAKFKYLLCSLLLLNL